MFEIFMNDHAGETNKSRIDWSVKTKHCAFCGMDLTGKKIVGSGSFSDGLFCSLDCYAKFHGSNKFCRGTKSKCVE